MIINSLPLITVGSNSFAQLKLVDITKQLSGQLLDMFAVLFVDATCHKSMESNLYAAYLP